MTNTQLLMAALAYSQCGNWREVADSLGTLTRDGLRCAVVRASKDNPVIVSALEEGRKLRALGDNVVIKLPLTAAGLQACREFHAEGVPTNVTLCFSLSQALMAAKAGATLRAIIALGKFHGVIDAQTPMGCLMTVMRLSGW